MIIFIRKTSLMAICRPCFRAKEARLIGAQVRKRLTAAPRPGETQPTTKSRGTLEIKTALGPQVVAGITRGRPVQIGRPNQVVNQRPATVGYNRAQCFKMLKNLVLF